jgi:DNA-binding LacI/PurR family transcriptional regulator
LGHERIATVTLPFGVEGETRILPASEARNTAWIPIHHRLDAFAIAGIEPCVIIEAHASMVEAGIAAGHLALNHESRPTAVVCQSDLLAGGVILAARAHELHVPEDLSVTGFDGIDLPWLTPHEVTTIKQDGAAKGHTLALEVKALLAGEVPEQVLLPLEYRPGNTVGPARER